MNFTSRYSADETFHRPCREVGLLTLAPWYVRRLCAMSAREIVARTSTQLEVMYDDLTYHIPGKRTWRKRWEGDTGVAPADRTPLIVSAGRAELARSLALRTVNELSVRAEQAVRRQISVFGLDISIDSAVQDADGVASRSWPDRHGLRIDYRRSGVGDPKLAWEANRLQHLPLLAAAWRLTDDPAFAEAAIADTQQWIDHHPVGRGIAWSNGYEAGLRTISLGLALDALASDAGRAWSEAVLRAIHQHVRWIERHPSLYSSANNHRIGELAGIVVASALFPELPQADVRLARAVAELERRCEEQFRGDGSHDEEALWYGLFSADLVLVAVAALSATSRRIPEGITAALSRFSDFLAATHSGEEPELRFGDADDGRATWLDGNELRTVRGVSASLAAALGHSGARRLAGELDATAIWLFGAEGCERFLTILPADPPGPAVLRDAGLVVLRSRGRRVTLDAGPLGDNRLAAHGHADALAVTLSVGATYVVGDPGTGTYFGEEDLRTALRGTGAHATVLVDGFDQSQQTGAFLWGRRAKARLRHVDLERGLAIATHDGYHRLSDPVCHERAVVLTDFGLLVYDRLDARSEHTYSQRWPMPPWIRAQVRESHALCVGPGVAATLATRASAPSVLRMIEGSDEPREGWWSPRFQAVEPAPLVSLDFAGTGVVHAAAFLAIASDPLLPPEVSLAVVETGRASTVSVEMDAASFAFTFDLDAAEDEQVVHTILTVAAR